MGRPTLTAQLAKAAADGDIEKVKELAARLNSMEKKPKTKAKTPKKKSKVEVYEEDLYKPDDVDENNQKDPNSDFIAPSRRSGYQQVQYDEDGEKHVRMRVVPFKIKKNRKNEFKDDLTQESADIDFDKIVHKHGVKRQYRPPTNKVKVKCHRCKQIKVVWPGEVLHTNWSCNDCLASEKRGRD